MIWAYDAARCSGSTSTTTSAARSYSYSGPSRSAATTTTTYPSPRSLQFVYDSRLRTREYENLPFGGTYSPSTTVSLAQRYTYTGRELNPASDLMYYRYRQYDPRVGRFGGRDPLNTVVAVAASQYIVRAGLFGANAEIGIIEHRPDNDLVFAAASGFVDAWEGTSTESGIAPYAYADSMPITTLDAAGLTVCNIYFAYGSKHWFLMWGSTSAGFRTLRAARKICSELGSGNAPSISSSGSGTGVLWADGYACQPEPQTATAVNDVFINTEQSRLKYNDPGDVPSWWKSAPARM